MGARVGFWFWEHQGAMESSSWLGCGGVLGDKGGEIQPGTTPGV